MNVPRIMKAIASLKLMTFFPGDDDACLALADDLAAMAESEEQIEWTVRRVRNLYSEWPGIHELRAVYCSKFKPRDGINAYSSKFIDGIPPEHPAPEPERLALPPGHLVSADPELDAAVQAAFKLRPRLVPPLKPRADLPANFQPVTQADIDKALSDWRDGKVREALGLPPQKESA